MIPPSIEASSPYPFHRYSFDYVYGEDSNQEQVYENTAKELVASTLQGYNSTVFAYGQTGTGKTYTMEGIDTPQHQGIIPRAVTDIFDFIMNQANAETKFLVRASYLQIYNEQIMDLLSPERGNLQIREDKTKGVFVEGLSEWMVRSAKEIKALIKRGSSMRATSATKMNEVSSRSHALFIIVVEQHSISAGSAAGAQATPASGLSSANKQRRPSISSVNDGKTQLTGRSRFRVGKLNLVDLAGSERVSMTGASGQRLEESKRINQSLSALGNVIAALTSEKGRRAHVPYRDSKLTRILEDSLGGNCKTTMMATISPARAAFLESLSTVKFAARAKQIKNDARVNEDLDQTALLRKYELELRRLRAELAEKTSFVQGVRDRSLELKLELERNKAEADREAVLRDLAAIAEELAREKSAKEELEQKIRDMNSRMLIGGGPQLHLHAALALQEAMKAEQGRVTELYRRKIVELEKEREGIADDKRVAQQYKQLLVKQRQILMQLTNRLRERDQYIARLQEDLAAYEQHRKILEAELARFGVQAPPLQLLPESSALASPASGPIAPEKPSQLDSLDASIQLSQDQPAEPSYSNSASRASHPVDGAAVVQDRKYQELVASLQRELESCRKELNDLRTEKVDIEAERRRFENDLEAALEREQRWVIEANRWHEEKAKFQNDMTKAKEVITTLQSQKEQLLAARQRLESKLKVEFENRVRAAVEAKMQKYIQSQQQQQSHQQPTPTQQSQEQHAAPSPTAASASAGFFSASDTSSAGSQSVSNGMIALSKLAVPPTPTKLPSIQDAERALRAGKDIVIALSANEGDETEDLSALRVVNPHVGSPADGGSTEEEELITLFVEQALAQINASILAQAGGTEHTSESGSGPSPQNAASLNLPNVPIQIDSDFLRSVLNLLQHCGSASSLLRSIVRRQLRRCAIAEEEAAILRDELAEVLKDAQTASVDVMAAVNQRRRMVADQAEKRSKRQLRAAIPSVADDPVSQAVASKLPIAVITIPEEDEDEEREDSRTKYDVEEDGTVVPKRSDRPTRKPIDGEDDEMDSESDDSTNVLGEEAAASMAAAAAGAIARVQQLERRVSTLLRSQEHMREELEEEIRSRDAVVLTLKLQQRKLEAELQSRNGTLSSQPPTPSASASSAVSTNETAVSALSRTVTSSASAMASVAAAMAELDRRERLLRERLTEVSRREDEVARAIAKSDEMRVAELASLRERQEALDEAIAVYEVQIQTLESHTKELTSRLDVQLQERKALRIIIEQRIKSLVDQLNARLMAEYEQSNSTLTLRDHEKLILRTITALHKLVAATAAALRQADESDFGRLPLSPNEEPPSQSSPKPVAPILSSKSGRSSFSPGSPSSPLSAQGQTQLPPEHYEASGPRKILQMGAIPSPTNSSSAPSQDKQRTPKESQETKDERPGQQVSASEPKVPESTLASTSVNPPAGTASAQLPRVLAAQPVQMTQHPTATGAGSSLVSMPRTPSAGIAKYLPPSAVSGKVAGTEPVPQPRPWPPSPTPASTLGTAVKPSPLVSEPRPPTNIPSQFLPPGAHGAVPRPTASPSNAKP